VLCAAGMWGSGHRWTLPLGCGVFVAVTLRI